jgi:hypothetical protein
VTGGRKQENGPNGHRRRRKNMNCSTIESLTRSSSAYIVIGWPTWTQKKFTQYKNEGEILKQLPSIQNIVYCWT